MSENDKKDKSEIKKTAKKHGLLFGKNWFYYFRILTMLSAAATVFYFYQEQNNYQAVSASDNRRLIDVSIPENSEIEDISQLLYDDNLIKSPKAFSTYANIHGTDNLKSGRFSLTQDLTVADIYQQLNEEPNYIDPHNPPLGVVFIQNGEDVEAIAKSFSSQTDWSEEDFRNAVNNEELISKLKEKYPKLLDSLPSSNDEYYKLEGYLFPSTYDFRNIKTLDDAIEQMVKPLDDFMQPYYDDLEKTNHTMHELLTLASLTEKEASNKNDKDVIAGVFWNRIDQNMALQSDVSVKYLMHNPSAILSNEDVDIDSPYNLYKNSGFGPGPFDSPGTESIKSTLFPKERDKGYMYFVSNLQTGQFVYSKTFEEHDKAVSNFNGDNSSTQ